jgi:hypothetical protein
MIRNKYDFHETPQEVSKHVQRFDRLDCLDGCSWCYLPIFIAVRREGEALATIATPADPADDDWQRASTIVCQIISERIECGTLRRRELACAMARGSIAVADLTKG